MQIGMRHARCNVRKLTYYYLCHVACACGATGGPYERNDRYTGNIRGAAVSIEHHGSEEHDVGVRVIV